ncbi:MAG: Glyoxalase/bleomycin resistance protein/dioxygenase [Frankiales bacterium]|nr:Glyoxalase/bleomycin resistance protein/dioxygenase [Frankiales bacterium]
MRALHVGLRVCVLERSLSFYQALGYEVIGEVPETGIGHLTMLKLPGDDFVTLELVSHPDFVPGGGDSPLSHLVLQVDDMEVARTQLSARGFDVEEATSPDGSPDFWTARVADPDGNCIELVQWPPGHAVGLTAADFA